MGGGQVKTGLRETSNQLHCYGAYCVSIVDTSSSVSTTPRTPLTFHTPSNTIEGTLSLPHMHNPPPPYSLICCDICAAGFDERQTRTAVFEIRNGAGAKLHDIGELPEREKTPLPHCTAAARGVRRQGRRGAQTKGCLRPAAYVSGFRDT